MKNLTTTQAKEILRMSENGTLVDTLKNMIQVETDEKNIFMNCMQELDEIECREKDDFERILDAEIKFYVAKSEISRKRIMNKLRESKTCFIRIGNKIN